MATISSDILASYAADAARDVDGVHGLVESGLHRRQGKAVSNFERTLPPPQSDLAQQTLKDPYTFDFLTLADDAHERHLERGLLEHIRQFLLELGVGFAFVGSQVHLEVGGEGSRAAGVFTEQSDWDFCLYYRGRFEIDAIRALGVPGDVFEPGAWGGLLNGGAWLEVDGASVDLLYRDLDVVEHELEEAEGGRFVIEEAQGYVAGLPS